MKTSKENSNLLAEMNLPAPVAGILSAQAQYDSKKFAAYFSDDAVVYDEGQTHAGRLAIEAWNKKTNQTYKTVLKPLYQQLNNDTVVLGVEVSGSFAGSPISVEYNFRLQNGQIIALRIS
jgi:hypothetical protein